MTAELEAVAAELGIPVADLVVPAFPTFRANKGYHLEIVDAKNTESQWGTSQVELHIVALDEAGERVQRAKGRFWKAYPFDTEAFKFADPDAKERALRDLGALVAVQGLANPFAKGLTPEARQEARNNLFKVLRLRQKSVPSEWIGLKFWAVYASREGKNGKTYTGWERFSAEQLVGPEYITEPSAMMSRPGSEDVLVDAATGADLF